MISPQDIGSEHGQAEIEYTTPLDISVWFVEEGVEQIINRQEGEMKRSSDIVWAAELLRISL